MDWTHLGHAAWLAEAGGLRLLFDPLLEDPHQGGTCAVWPRREIHVEALKPDFVLVSHAHADHLDVRSLLRLARLDADTVVITPDPLVAHVARRVGFRVVRELPAGQVIELDGARLVLTPSLAPDPEWGVVVETEEGVAWNQVDTVLGGPGAVRRVVHLASPRRGIDLAMVRWAPLLEIEAQVPGSLAFPFAAYSDVLEEIASVGAGAVVPCAAGQRHARGAWLDHVVMPVSPARVAIDLARRCPATRVLPACTGGVLHVRGGVVWLDATAGRHLVTPSEDRDDPRTFRPLAIPELHDAATREREPQLAAAIEPWIDGPLRHGVDRALRGLAEHAPIRLGLEVVFPSGPRSWTATVERERTRVEGGLAADLDVLDAITASALADVLDGRRSWGHVLLAGELRASDRGYRLTERGLERLPIAPIFLYYALPYAESTRRTVLRELDAALAGAVPPWHDDAP